MRFVWSTVKLCESQIAFALLAVVPRISNCTDLVNMGPRWICGDHCFETSELHIARVDNVKMKI